MEQCPVTFGSNMSQLHGFVCDPKTMCFENSSKAFSRAEVICPRPYHASRIPMFMEGVNKFCPKSKSILPKQKEDSSFEFRDIILNKDDQYGDLDGGAQVVFFCGSPPVRSRNPVARDEQFTKQTKPIFSPLPVNSFGVGKSCARVDRASPICGSFSGNPKVRIEGFTCKKSDSRSAVPALA